MAQKNQVGGGRLESKKHSGTGTLPRKWTGVAAMLIVVFALSVSALQNPGQSSDPQTGARNAGVKPKRAPERREKRKGGKAAASSARRETGSSMIDSLSPILAAADFDLVGLAVTAGPASLTVPKNTPTSIQTSVRVPEGTDPASIIAALNPNYLVRGELTGPSLTAPLTLEAPIGQPLKIPGLSNAGDHLVRNLRVVDTSDQSVITSVTPDSCGIVVIERLLISQVEVHELTYDQIIQAGINITDDSYKAFNFTLGLATSSTVQTITIPVAFPSVGVTDPRPLVGIPSVSAPGIDVPTVLPIMLTTEGPDAEPSGNPPAGGDGGPVRIPGVIVFPGRVGFLHQFFEAIVIVGNGAPNGTPLVIHSLRAKAHLPDNGTPADLSDDPLRIAETQTGGRVSELDLHGLGPDGKYGTGDDTVSFGPGQFGQASFLLEGLKEGLHTINFDLEAMLEGLPGGPVKVRGEVPGAVLVRDASFAVTFTHPGVVRAGNEYDLGMTIYNSGQTDIQGTFAQLLRNSISGAELIGQDTGQRQFATTIRRGESATVKWRLRSNTTGEVTASYVKVGDGVSAGLTLVTGVGDRNIPLSPDSLILPDPVKHLPLNVVEAGRALLGQAWSIANAPSGSLPPGVTTVTKQTVVNRAVELGIAGMRVDFGEPVSVSLDTIMRDWLGELQSVPDRGFADTQRNTRSGYEWFDSLGDEFYKRLNGGASSVTAVDLHQEFANTELPRSRFISALVTQANGQPIVGSRFVDAHDGRVGFGASPDERDGAFAQGSSLRLVHTDIISGASTSVGQMLAVSNPTLDNWTLELNGWLPGTVDISLLAPATSQAYSQFVWTGVQITEGVKYRIRFKPLSVSTAPVLEEYRDGSWQATTATAAVTTLNQPAPSVVGVIQVTPEVVAGGDKYGRLVGVLFSKPMAQDQAQTLSRYKIGGGVLKGSSPAQLVGGPIGVTGARIDYGNRFVFLSLNSTIGPYIDRDLTITSLQDTLHLSLSPTPTIRTIMPRVSLEGRPPGAYLTGRVLNADGTPVAKAPVMTWAQECPDGVTLFPPPPKPIVLKYTDAQGRYEIDYVRDSDCAPLNVTVNNPTTNSEKRLTSAVAYDGQHMVLDMVFLARGNVEGNITSAGQPMPKAFVRVVPDLDVIGTKVVQADLNGHYVARDVPVGNVSVLAVGFESAHNASGFAAGTINGQGQTAFINVSLQNISGVVRGHVFRQDLTPSAGALVVAYEVIPGFHSPNRNDGATAVGYAFADRDGSFTIANLPVGTVKLEVTDYVTGLIARQDVQLTTAIPEVNGIVITLLGTGSVSGRVTDDLGAPLANVFVSSSGGAVQTDSLGQYTLPGLPGGMRTIAAFDAATQRIGSAQAPVTVGQTTTGIDIVILRPSMLQGTVSVIKEGTSTPLPAAGVLVSADGFVIVSTDAQGHYTIPNVSSGDLTIRFVDPGKAYAVNSQIKLAPGETLTRDATFRPGTVHGKVFQPDGVTTTIAQVSIYVPRPEPTQGYAWGLLSTEPPLSTQTTTDGSYSLSGLNPGKYRLTTSNVFFPTPVSNGGVLPPGGNEETNLTLVSTLAGKIQGRVFQPDGTTLVGPGIRVTLGGGSLADATVRTDEGGHYEFGEVFSAGGYHLTATDPVSGNTNRIGVSVERNKDAVFDLRLLGSGNLRVQVLDGAGQPVQGGSVTLDGTDYPNAHRFAEVTPGSSGLVTFSNLPEGPYAISATQHGLGGRVSARVPNGATVDVSVQLQATGNVEGHVYLPDGVTPISLADVQLSVGGRSVGFTVTSEEPDIGKFTFVNVPTGDFTLDVFDNHTGRVGRAAGGITAQGQTAVVNVLLLPIGAVSGRVTANGISVDHAAVYISADGSGVRGANLFATTDPDGHYRFTGIPAGRFVINVSDAPGGQTGSASGTITGTVEPLPDTIVDIALEPSQTVTGTVVQQGGTAPVSGAQVMINAGGRVFQTATNDQGVYSLGFVPLGAVRVRAEAPVGYDRGEAAPVFGTQPGATVTVNVTLAGVGIVSGDALDNNGVRLAVGTVTFTNDAWGIPIVLYASVQANGHYEVPGAPVGHFSLRLIVPSRVGVGSASGEVLAGQTTNLPLRLEDAGTVTGLVQLADETTAVQGASVALTLHRPGGSLSFYAHTNAQGVWTLNNVPLGTLDILVTDEVSGGIARARNVALATNDQTVDIGTMLLDSTPISVVSVEPANGTQSVPTNGTVVRITFSEPVEASTVNSGTVQLQQGTFGIGTTLTLSSDGRVVTLTPLNRLVESATYKVLVNQIEDRAGLHIANAFNSTFTTADESAPTVMMIAPANSATEIPSDASIIIGFNEPIDRNANLAEIIKVAANQSPDAPLTGSYELDTFGSVATFRPAGGLTESTRYTISVNGQRDASGNVQTQAFVSTFATQDRTAPVIDPLPIDGAIVHSLRPAITATYHDNLSGIKTSSVVLMVDNINVTQSAVVTASQVTYTPAVSLALGPHNVTVEVTDNAGNVGALHTATFSVGDETVPSVTTIAPPNSATDIPTDASILVSFDEPIDRSANLADVIKVAASQSPDTLLTGSYELDAGGSVATFRPAGGFSESSQYTITVNGQRDASGNIQTHAVISIFTTQDRTAPVIDPLPIDGTIVHPFRPTITATYHDNLSGIKTSSVVLTVDNVNVTQSAVVTATQISYTPAVSLAVGPHNVTVEAADNAGNASAVRTASFSIEDAGITINSFMINEQVAVDGMIVTNVPRPIFLAVYTDESGIDTTQTKLLLSRQGDALQAVSAVVTESGLRYQPDQPLTAGAYTVQLLVVDQLGQQSASGVIGFTLSLQSPEILSILPSTGGTTGGTLATITGNYLLDATVPPDANAHGLSAEYYQHQTYGAQDSIGLRLTRTDAAIDFDWESDTPSPYIDPSSFEAKWRGQIQPLYSETYTFHVDTDTLMQLWINGQVIYPHRIEDANINSQSSIDLVVGQRYDIRVEYNGYYAGPPAHKARLFWSSSSQAQQIVPSAQLYPAAQPPFPLVFVGGQQATVIGVASDSPNQVACMIPANVEGPANVELRDSAGSATLANGFTYAADLDGPRPIAYSVRNTTTEVPSSTPLRITFSEPLDPTQDLSSVVFLSSVFSGEMFVGTVTLDETGRVATFIPATTLPDDDTYSFYTRGARDLAGNATPFSEGINFATTDRSGPQIYVFPENNTVVDTRTPLIAAYYYDHASGVDPASFELTVDGVDVSSQSSREFFYLRYFPQTPLASGLHTASARGRDLVGHLSETTFSFTVNPPVPVIQAFTIAGMDAVDGLATANTFPQIFVQFHDQHGINTQATKLFFGHQNSTLTQVPITVNYAWWLGSYYVYYNQPQALEFGLYSVRFEATNLQGNTITKTVNFEVRYVDVTPPQLVETFPVAGAIQVPTDTRVIFTFDEALDPSQDFASEFLMTASTDDDEQPVAGSISLDETHRILTFTPAAPLHESTPYFASIYGFRDLAGNRTYWGSYTYFATVDHEPPTVESLQISGQPADGLHVTLRRPTIFANFYDVASGADSSTAAFTIDGVAVTDGVYPDYSVAYYDPPTPLAPGPHTVSVRVSDRAGNVSSPLSATFVVDDAVSIATVAPTRGFTQGGRPLTISGSGMINSDGSRPVIKFGNAQVSDNNDYYVTDDFGATIVINQMPTGESGTVDVVVQTDHGTATLSNGYTYDDAVSISVVTPNHGFTAGGEPLRISGAGMVNSDGTRPLIRFGGTLVQEVNEYTVDNEFGTGIAIEQMPAGPAGTVDVIVETDHGTATLPNGYTYEIDPKTPFAVEADTLLLWHLDRFIFTGDGCRYVTDAGPRHLDSRDCYTHGEENRGRFGGGINRATLPVENDNGTLAFGASPFTVEGWIRSNLDPNNPPAAPLNIFTRFDSQGQSSDYALTVLPSGDVNAQLLNAAGDVWQATMSASSLSIGDNQWHSVAMVVERGTDPAQGRLVIYIDGEERASSAMPANFGAIRDGGGRFVASTQNNGWYNDAILDEVRVSTTAHSADLIRRTYQGDALGFVVLRRIPGVLQRGETTEVIVEGYNLDNISASLTASDGTPLPAIVTPLDVAHTIVRLGVVVDQSVPLGPAVLNLSSGGQAFAQPVHIVEQRPFSVDSGTVLLWHLDESGGYNTGIVDASPSGIDGYAGFLQPGRFGNGRDSANTFSLSSKPALSFGSQPFTASCWIKAVNTVSDSDLLQLRSAGTLKPFTIRLLHTGVVSAVVQSLQGTVWQADTPAQSDDFANNQWHLITMVVERGSQAGENNLKIYVDGTERVSSQAPVGFGALPNANGTFGVGFIRAGAIDEVRILNYAQTATQAAEDWFGPGQSGAAGKAPTPSQQKSQAKTDVRAGGPVLPPTPAIQILSLSAREVVRDKAAPKPVVTALTIEGDGLEEISAHVSRDGKSLDGVAVRVRDSAARLAHIEVSVAPTVKLCGAQLVLRKLANEKVVTAVDIHITEPSEFALEADTIGLWHLDERDEGATHLLDASEHAINLSTAQTSRVVEGRFGGGRALVRATADVSSDALSLGTSSFTVEGWVKTEALTRDYVLVGKETNSGQNTDFTLKALSSGALRAEVYDASGLAWQAETPETLTDGKWHAVTFVVDREAGLLSLYIDGQMRVAAPAPVGFAAVRNLGQPLEFGCFDADGAAGTGPEEFPGFLDEIRISSAAHTPEKIAADFFGHDEPEFTLASPAMVRKGTGPVEVTLSGYGLAGAGVTANQPGVAVSVISSNFTSIKLSLTLSDSVAPGPIQLTITEILGRTITVELNAIERGTGSRNVSPGAGGVNGSSQARDSMKRQVPPSSSHRPPDPVVSTSGTRSQTGSSLRSSRPARDAKSVGGQR